MTLAERKKAYLKRDQEAAICRNCDYCCVHFVYQKESDQFVEISYGHCIYRNNKSCMQYNTCEHFKPRQD